MVFFAIHAGKQSKPSGIHCAKYIADDRLVIHVKEVLPEFLNDLASGRIRLLNIKGGARLLIMQQKKKSKLFLALPIVSADIPLPGT